MLLLLLSSAFFLTAQAAYFGYPEGPYAHSHQQEEVPPFQEHYDELYFGEYPLTPNQSLFVRAIQHVAPRVLIDHDYQRAMAQASNPSEFYFAVVRDPEAVDKEMPELVKFVQDYVQAVERQVGSSDAAVQDPKNFFNVIAPKLFMAVKALQFDGLLRDYLQRIGLPDYVFARFYLMVLQNPAQLYVQDGQREIEQALSLQPGTVQKLKQYFYEDSTIYYTFRRYMANYVGSEENNLQEHIQEVSKLLTYAEYIQNILAQYKVTIQDVLQEYRKILENPQVLHSDGIVSLGSSPAAQALEAIIKGTEGAYSGVAPEEKTQQVIIS
ncbi:uncharacterized protein LOC111872406 isoform X2 [Cryptotermes secundus]|uniref:uncharacterized protein LOC111872406 isoform X2 n=1 Tax=Cryptotermes secundus TaxID=105785 RepID=UPI000CD7B86C|nr:uncharacterized protein LOC111872406 isoform X2 [Cryptotermes secundus]